MRIRPRPPADPAGGSHPDEGPAEQQARVEALWALALRRFRDHLAVHVHRGGQEEEGDEHDRTR
jgi:hypothetical protein